MFNEANSVENYIRDLLCAKQPVTRIKQLREQTTSYVPQWQYVAGPQLKRKETDV